MAFIYWRHWVRSIISEDDISYSVSSTSHYICIMFDHSILDELNIPKFYPSIRPVGPSRYSKLFPTALWIFFFLMSQYHSFLEKQGNNRVQPCRQNSLGPLGARSL